MLCRRKVGWVLHGQAISQRDITLGNIEANSGMLKGLCENLRKVKKKLFRQHNFSKESFFIQIGQTNNFLI